MKKELSTEPYKGVRDFFPEDMSVEKHIFAIWRKIAEQYGYEEYGASVLEPAELYRAKTGEEIVNEQTYTFKDRGDREVTLRPEMTPTLARMVAAKKRELSFPLRWYSIPNLFRYEQPQRGRTREHWQLNVDIFGVASFEADVEIISLAHKIMTSFGAKETDFEIRINDLQLMNDWFEKNYGITDPIAKKDIIKILDRKRKITEEEFKEKIIKTPISKERFEQFRQELDLDIESFVNLLNAEVNNLRIILIKNALNELGINNVVFDQTITRGFDYYTGLVFEIFDTNKENRRSLFGGGRYDNLTSLFNNDKIPAVGFGVGDVTFKDFLDTHALLPPKKTSIDFKICVIGQAQAGFAMKVADILRTNGFNACVDLSFKKLGEQISDANKKMIANIIVIGEDEQKSGSFQIKSLSSGKETPSSLDQLASQKQENSQQ